jgi:hypothetical protein
MAWTNNGKKNVQNKWKFSTFVEAKSASPAH